MLIRRRHEREPDSEAGHGRVRSVALRPSLQALEERSLLSTISLAGRPHLAGSAHVTPIARHVVAARGQVPGGRESAFSKNGQVNEKIVGGHVSKAPHFYSEYSGPRRADLNGIGAMGKLVLGVGYVFTGRVLGPITPTQTAYYVFGVDRGGASAGSNITPSSISSDTVNYTAGKSIVNFPRRPDIFVDALVTVEVGPSGTQGHVLLMGQNSGEGTPLPTSDIQISGTDVTVIVPPSLLPPNGLPATRFYYAFWTRSESQGASNVASFVPEYNITRIGFQP